MKIDFYTKAVLTVIAAALLYLCAAKGNNVQADSPQRVIIVRTEQPLPITDGFTVDGKYIPVTWTNRLPVREQH